MMDPAEPYDRLGVQPLINASSTVTNLGGSLMPQEVVAAMQAAATQYVDIAELQAAAGQRIAALTGNEAAHVTAGCAAAIVLATLATINLGEPRLITRPPLEDGLAVDVIVDRSHDIAFLPAIRLAGGRVVWIGSDEQTTAEDLQAAITEETAAVFYVAGGFYEGTALALDETIDIAHSRGVPVIVDAAAQLPPVENLWRYTKVMGADLALFSGGKGLRGPQSSGLIVGDRRYVAACAANASPAPGLARALKVGKEEIIGLLRAVEVYVGKDHQADQHSYELVCANWVAGLNELPGVTALQCQINESGQPSPRVLVTVASAEVGGDAIELQRELWDHTPRVAVRADSPDTFYITPDTLSDGEADTVFEAIRAACDRLRMGVGGP
ncbi:MAG: aminotransferase class V-fold PLP-dependent enzyme [Acidimicrobiia bacterium]|nr:MAG: aminotransferase class V-fold PLP-dependent enzyme [Acidimicrobiia bacterium]